MAKLIIQFKKYYFVCLVAFMTTSCGFKPVYSSANRQNIEEIRDIEIEITAISTTEDADFYNYIRNMLPTPKQQPKYKLAITLFYDKTHNIIQPNSDILRDTQTLKTSYSLFDLSTEKQITSGNFTKISSYSTSFSPYSNISLEQETRKNLAQISAEGVYNKLLLFFENKKK